MNNIITCSVINNEISYIKDVIDHHLPWVDGMYILDTGSTDGTLEYLQNLSENNPKLIVEKYFESFIPQYELNWDVMQKPFPEVIVRNYALRQAEKAFNPIWTIGLDGDEVWLPETKDLLNNNISASCVGCSTINPVELLEKHPIEKRGGFTLYDPHVRIVKSDLKAKYIINPHLKGKQIHCIPAADGFDNHLFHHPNVKFTDKILHFHLHWMYGSKIELPFKLKGFTNRSEMVAEQTTNIYSKFLPTKFWNARQDWLSNIT